MPISPAGKATDHSNRASGRRRAGARGFTLIELLVVISILSVLALGVGLNAGGGLGSSRAPLDRFAQAFDDARLRATLGRQVLGLRPEVQGWQELRRTGEAWINDTPENHSDTPLTWRVNGAVWVPAGGAVPIVILPQGSYTPFVVSAGAKVCRGDGWRAMVCT